MTSYRTRDPYYAQQWHSTLDQRTHDRRTQIDAFLATHLLPATSTAIGDDNLLVGLVWDAGPIPAGWREHRARPGVICPNEATDQGRRLAQDLGSITHTNGMLILPGDMPARIATPTGELLPQIQADEEMLWVIWSGPVPEGTAIDPRVWEVAS